MARKKTAEGFRKILAFWRKAKEKKGLARTLKLLFSAGANSLAPGLQGKIQSTTLLSVPGGLLCPLPVVVIQCSSSLSASSHISPDSFPPNHRPSGVNPSTYRLTAQHCRPSLGLRSCIPPPGQGQAHPSPQVPFLP